VLPHEHFPEAQEFRRASRLGQQETHSISGLPPIRVRVRDIEPPVEFFHQLTAVGAKNLLCEHHDQPDVYVTLEEFNDRMT